MQLSAFDTLNVSVLANDDVIKSAYLALVRDNPPDQNPARFEAIREAYEQIATNESRLDYLLFQSPLIGFNELMTKLSESTEPEKAVGSELIRLLMKEALHVK